jgi:hypothetical protein
LEQSGRRPWRRCIRASFVRQESHRRLAEGYFHPSGKTGRDWPLKPTIWTERPTSQELHLARCLAGGLVNENPFASSNHACLTASIGSTRSHGIADKHVMVSASPITTAVTGASTVHSTAPIR